MIDMRALEPTVASLFRVPGRFLRSVQLERDFQDVEALDQYLPTPTMAEAFARVTEGLRPGSGRRAWRVTGDYGVGKSSFALVLAHLAGTRSRAADAIAVRLGLSVRADAVGEMWPILLTGSREAIVVSLARGVAEALLARVPARGRVPRQIAALVELGAAVEASGSVAELERFVEAVRGYAALQGAGILLIVDEMGKLLEHAAQRADREDVFVLQRLAELAARSGERPFMVVGLLHQGFQAYAERLPSESRHEWEKVAGRFEEIVFDQPLAHTAALVAGALNIDAGSLPRVVAQAAQGMHAAVVAAGWPVGVEPTRGSATASTYPLHPALLPVLVRFFARFGQHERSLFGFLLSSEPFGLQAFAERTAAGAAWYGLPDFYDYVRSVFGHRLAGASYRNQWLRIVGTVDAAAELESPDVAVLKAAALLNMLDADDLPPTARALKAAFEPAAAYVDEAIARLHAAGLLFRRGTGGHLRLWPHSSVNLEAALAAAATALGQVDAVGAALLGELDRDPILARRHYVETGTLRYFEVRHGLPGRLADALLKPIAGDGLVLMALPDTEDDRDAILVEVRSPALIRDDVLVGVIAPLQGLAPELRDVRSWRWLAANTPELAEDGYAAAEVSRQLAATTAALAAAIADRMGLRVGSTPGIIWYRGGLVMEPPRRGAITALLSNICDELYPSAPLITNELINRNALSSAASAARMRLLEGVLVNGHLPYVGIDPGKSPPEKSMYLSILERGGLHIVVDGRPRLVLPMGADPLRLRPSLDRLISTLTEARGGRVAVQALFDELARPPFGVRAGVAPLLLAVVMSIIGHELAVYENGTYLHRFGAADFYRLVKAPRGFEIQHCQVAGVRLEVFRELAAAFAEGLSSSRAPEILDVVRPLCRFAAQLPEHSRRTGALGASALAVREALISAREPTTMLFSDLPLACGSGAFTPDDAHDGARVGAFIDTLRNAVEELRAAYPALLARIISRTADAVGQGGGDFDRARLANRASKVSLAARAPRVRTFALRLRDPGLHDEGWAEALASFIISKPPSRWNAGDEARFNEEVGSLGELFHRIEATAFRNDGMTPALDAIRLNLTRGDGEDLVRIVDPSPDDGGLAELADRLRNVLPKDARRRLQVLTQLLWTELGPETDEDAVVDGDRKTGRAS